MHFFLYYGIIAYMKRKLLDNLVEWKNSRNRKPILLKGARQVGKSYLLEEFGKNYFNNVHVFNFEKDNELHSLFEKNLDPQRIITELSFYSETKIDIENDIVIFDEIQECPKAITSLKYFCEDLKTLCLCAAGSLLGVKLSSESFPVGKVDIFSLYPMSFEEFLWALDTPMLLEAYNAASSGRDIPDTAHNKLLEKLYYYFICGGLPEAVKALISELGRAIPSPKICRKIQENLIQMYISDFAKHSGKTNSMHIVSVFENIPSQLAGYHDLNTKRFRFKGVIPGKKGYNDLMGPIAWLDHAGLILKIKICNRSEIPLEAFTSQNIFKCYLFDIGILGAMLGLNRQDILNQDYGITKGYFAENFVAQELTAAGVRKLYSWIERNSEMEFLLQREEKIIPIEVKAGSRTQVKSLKQYILKYSPVHSKILSLNKLSFNKEKNIKYIPLYLAGKL